MFGFDDFLFLKRLNRAIDRVLKRIRNALAAIGDKLDRKFKRAGRKSRVTKTISKADNQTVRVFRFFGLPFKRIWNNGTSVFHSIRLKVIASPLYKKLKKSTRWLWHPVFSVAVFCKTLIGTRSRLAIVGSLASIVVLTAIFLVVWRFQTPQNRIKQNYQAAINQAFLEGNVELAQRYHQKLLDLGSKANSETMLRITSLADSGKMGEAMLMAEQFAGLDQPGLPEAHFWLAQQYLRGKTNLPRPEALAAAERHLQLLEQSLLNDSSHTTARFPQISMVKAILELRKANVDAALEQLNSVNQFWPAVALQIELLASIGRTDQASEKSIQLLDLVNRNPTILTEFNEVLFEVWYPKLLTVRPANQLRDVVNAWYQNTPTNPTARIEFSRLQLADVDLLISRGSENDIAKAYEILTKAVNVLGPENHMLVSAWFNFRVPPVGKNPRYASLIHKLENDSDSPSFLVEVLGTLAYQSGDHARALQLYRRATDLDGNNVIALNNLAFMLSVSPEGDLNDAWSAANKCVQAEPENLTFRKTRAQVSLRMKKFDIAIEDLKQVIARQPVAPKEHDLLAEAYRAVGETILANFHEELGKIE